MATICACPRKSVLESVETLWIMALAEKILRQASIDSEGWLLVINLTPIYNEN